MRIITSSRKGRPATFSAGNDRADANEAPSLVKARLGWLPDHCQVMTGGQGSYVFCWSERKSS